MRRPLLLVLLASGVALAAAHASWMALAPDRNALLVVAGAELAAGRETALSTGLALGLPWHRAALVTTGIEWSMLLVGAPLLILGGDWLRERRFLRRHLARAEAFARRRPRTGILALSALTLTPFFPLGALTSVLIGEVLTLPMLLLIPALALAELLANFGFAYAAARAISLFPDPRVGAALMVGTILLVVLLLALWPRRRTETAM